MSIQNSIFSDATPPSNNNYQANNYFTNNTTSATKNNNLEIKYTSPIKKPTHGRNNLSLSNLNTIFGSNNTNINNINNTNNNNKNNNLEMKDLSSIRRPQHSRHNLSSSNVNTFFGSSNNNNKTNFFSNSNDKNDTIIEDSFDTDKAFISDKSISTFYNCNLKAQKDQNINNINITNNTNNIFIGNINDEKDKNTILKDKDVILNLQSKKTFEIKKQEKQKIIMDNEKLKEIEEKLNKFYSNGIVYS